MPTSSSHHLPAGHVLRGEKYSYRIDRVLGQGSFGITYQASIQLEAALGSLNANVSVAVKEFFMKDLNDCNGTSVTSGSKSGLYDKYKERFAREAQNLGRLRHPHIVQVLESFAANNTFYYAMEYIGGGSLDDYIARRGTLAEPEAIRLVAQIGDALTYMHANKMLHLDLKPGNIVMRPDGAAVLIDFGLSKQYDEQGVPESSTTIGGGTPGYAPIEQAQYHEGHGFPTAMDVYALGATLFKMLTGQRPPEAADVLNDGFPAALLQARGVSTATIGCIEKAMSPMKGQRYQTVMEFLAALHAPLSTIEDEYVVVDEGTKLDGSTDSDPMAEPVEGLRHSSAEASRLRKKSPPTNQILATPLTPAPSFWRKHGMWLAVAVVVLGVAIGVWMGHSNNTEAGKLLMPTETNATNADATTAPTAQQRDRVVPPPSSSTKCTYMVNGISFSMVTVEGGTFTMGTTSEHPVLDANEKLVHPVTLLTYSIGQTEVTQALWQAVMGSNPSYFKGDNLPVENVSRYDCQTFISKLNALTGERFRLPTEAEWEFAARGGTKSRGYLYSGSNTLSDVAWYRENSGSKTHPVGTKRANELGIYDMSGNIYELCEAGQSNRKVYVGRGGCYNSLNGDCHVTNRVIEGPTWNPHIVGLRLAISLPKAQSLSVPETKQQKPKEQQNDTKTVDGSVDGRWSQ